MTPKNHLIQVNPPVEFQERALELLPQRQWRPRSHRRRLRHQPLPLLSVLVARARDLHLGVSKKRGTPNWIVKIMENPIKMDDLGIPLFLETPICFLDWYTSFDSFYMTHSYNDTHSNHDTFSVVCFFKITTAIMISYDGTMNLVCIETISSRYDHDMMYVPPCALAVAVVPFIRITNH